MLRISGPGEPELPTIRCCRLSREARFKSTTVFMNCGRIGKYQSLDYHNPIRRGQLDDIVALKASLLKHPTLAFRFIDAFSSRLDDALILDSKAPLAVDVAASSCFSSALDSMLA